MRKPQSAGAGGGATASNGKNGSTKPVAGGGKAKRRGERGAVEA